jgi:hypothetical protein
MAIAEQDFGGIPFKDLVAKYKIPPGFFRKELRTADIFLTREDEMVAHQRQLDEWYKMECEREIRRGNFFEKLLYKMPDPVQRVLERRLSFGVFPAYRRARNPFKYPRKLSQEDY